MRPEQLRLERHQVPVARRAVDEALEVEVVLDPERDGHRAHPDPGHRRVGDVDDVDARVAQEPGGLDRALDPDAPRRVDLDRDHESAGLEQLGQPGRRRRVVGVGGPPRRSNRSGDRVRASAVGRSAQRRVGDGSSAARIAAMCSGVVPQQPPTIRAPASSIRGVTSPKYPALAA